LALERIKGLFEVVKILTRDFMKSTYIRLSTNLKTSLQIPLALGWNLSKGIQQTLARTALSSPTDFLLQLLNIRIYY